MRRALNEYRIIGIKTTIPFHQQVMDSTVFIAGLIDTTFLEKRFSMVQDEPSRHAEVAAVAAVLLAHQRRQQALALTLQHNGRPSPWKQAGRWEAIRR